jgi:hypothetical protein
MQIARTICTFICAATLSACSTGTPGGTSDTESNANLSQAKLKSDPEFTQLRSPSLSQVVQHATAAASVRDYVRAKYPDLSALSFCEYFGSPEFAAVASKLTGKRVNVIALRNMSQALSRTYSYTSNTDTLVIYPDEGDSFRCSYFTVGMDGKLRNGGSITIRP